MSKTIRKSNKIVKLYSLLTKKKSHIIWDKLLSKMSYKNWSIKDYQNASLSTKEFIKEMGLIYRDLTKSEGFLNSKEIASRKGLGMGGGGNIDLLGAITRSLPPYSLVIETGVSMGWSSKTILENLNEGRLISTDLPYPGADNDIGFLVPKNLRRNWVLLVGLDSTLLPALENEIKRAAMIHYDSDKNYVGKLRSLKFLYAHMAKDSWLIVDDISDNSAFDDFCESYSLEPYIVYFANLKNPKKKQYVGVIKKG